MIRISSLSKSSAASSTRNALPFGATKPPIGYALTAPTNDIQTVYDAVLLQLTYFQGAFDRMPQEGFLHGGCPQKPTHLLDRAIGYPSDRDHGHFQAYLIMRVVAQEPNQCKLTLQISRKALTESDRPSRVREVIGRLDTLFGVTHEDL